MRNTGKRLGISQCKAHVLEARGLKIQDFSLLQQCLESFAVCSKCKSSKSRLKIFEDNSRRKGLGECLFIKCSSCGAKQSSFSSKKMPGKGSGFEVDRRAAIAIPNRGTLKRFCARMDLPPPVSKTPYNRHVMEIENALKVQADDKMNDAAARLSKVIKTEEPSKVIRLEGGQDVAQGAVTVDSTWQKRGHSSKIGVVFIISVRTGEVVKYEVLSQVCHECIHYGKIDRNSPEYKKWKAHHSDACSINHKGSSGSMEVKGTVMAFRRSIEKRSLMYTKFVGDGDSSCFGSVLEAIKKEFGSAYPWRRRNV